MTSPAPRPPASEGPPRGRRDLAGPGDASTRRYFRLREGSASHVLALHPEPFVPEESTFVVLRGLLASCGLPVPAIVEADGLRGVLLLQDLGDATLQEVLRETSAGEREELYREATEQLVTLQREAVRGPRQAVCFQISFDIEKLSWELHYFLKHFLEGARLVPRRDLDGLREGLSVGLGQDEPPRLPDEDRLQPRSVALGHRPAVPLVVLHPDAHRHAQDDGLLAGPNAPLELVPPLEGGDRPGGEPAMRRGSTRTVAASVHRSRLPLNASVRAFHPSIVSVREAPSAVGVTAIARAAPARARAVPVAARLTLRGRSRRAGRSPRRPAAPRLRRRGRGRRAGSCW